MVHLRKVVIVALMSSLASTIEVVRAQAEPAADIRVVVECNRSQYYLGEPVVLRWQLRNSSRLDWPVRFAAIGIGHGFSLWYRLGISPWKEDTRAIAMEPPDQAFIRTPLAPGSTAERLDLFLPEEVGKYEVKVIVDAGEQGAVESEPAAFEVVPPSRTEPLLGLLGRDTEALKSVGRYAFVSHYKGGSPGGEDGFLIVGRDGRTIMKGVAPLIVQAEAEAPTSRYLPYLQYAFVCNNAGEPLTRRDVTALLRRRAETLWNNTDPTFWVKPQAGLGLFRVYRALGLTQQARTVGEQLLQTWPESALLRNSALESKLQALPAP